MKQFNFLIVAGLIFMVSLFPFYHYRHEYTSSFLNNHPVCYGVSYTSAPPFSQCASISSDCFTNTNGGTYCSKYNMADLISFGGITLVIALFLLLGSLVIAIPICRKLGWPT